MKRLNESKITLLIVAFVPALMLAAGSANADFTFGEPKKVSGLRYNEWIDYISYDGLEMFTQALGITDEQGTFDVWVRKRASKDEDWGPAENLGPLVNSSYADFAASISSDGLTLYFISAHPDGYGDCDIYATTRATRNDPWGPAVNLGPTINSSSNERTMWVSADNLELYFGSNRPGGYGGSDIYVATRVRTDDPWGAPVNLGPAVNTPYAESNVSLSADGLLLLFSEWYATTNIRPGGHGAPDIWMTRRATLSDPWQTPVNLGPPINGPTNDVYPWISPDGHTLHFRSIDREGGGNWQAPIIPVVDFNGDGIVDAADMCIVVDHWGENYPLFDIGPMPWGDGIVDVQDLIVLAEHLFEDVNDPTLLAHWKLDEAEGMFAHDSVGNNDAFVIGAPVWQPTGGQVNGALQLDGVDDCVVTNPILEPAEGPFSVFVWVRGGAPGRAVLSQIGGVSWLCTDSLEGNLMTELKGPGQSADPLLSQTVITDGNWHRIGFVWDGSNRKLYVDDVEVAKDAQDGLELATGGFYIGTGKAMEAGTYWSGLIDDVRIYNRVVIP